MNMQGNDRTSEELPLRHEGPAEQGEAPDANWCDSIICPTTRSTNMHFARCDFPGVNCQSSDVACKVSY